MKATPAACGEVLMKFPDAKAAGELAARVAAIPGIDTVELLRWAKSSVSKDTLAKIQAALGTRATA